MHHLWTSILTGLMALTGVFLMFIILLQRGRGGGLAGAFGAAGGQSAFGTKAGDVFTKITIGVAVFWVALAAVTGYAMRTEGSRYNYQGTKAEDEKDGMVAPKPGDNKQGGKEDAFDGLEKPAKPEEAAAKTGTNPTPTKGANAAPPKSPGSSPPTAPPKSGATGADKAAPAGNAKSPSTTDTAKP